jgi:hypothetical protein
MWVSVMLVVFYNAVPTQLFRTLPKDSNFTMLYQHGFSEPYKRTQFWASFSLLPVSQFSSAKSIFVISYQLLFQEFSFSLQNTDCNPVRICMSIKDLGDIWLFRNSSQVEIQMSNCLMKSIVHWVVTVCNSVWVHQSFWGMHHFCLQGWRVSQARNQQ